ncbi:hypothetical protein SPJ221_199 [Staphylococcus phage vB_SauH_SPJ2]|nr:hypothetical protein F422_gp024 [Staphylococcus phage SA11]QQO38027.1 hypothetical protein LSA2308_00006 [Staphylococcus phage LSA2308]QYC52153.1 hypothetical protein RP15_gp133 [Staphylococcus phage vB_Sau-RP15]USZ62826.1 hypothetical protein LSA2311_orf00018 [Staphylococcus phage LSA2311]UVD42406.1 hypothetical protein [Staphylococcus phage vB_SauM-V1SA19]UVD42709.1 hypothetical protein [Staphylococcus phage vB_SauM-V1SA22]WEW53565.1 hypothetical protein SPJ221_16 [Staphylococcus phage v
MRDIRIVLREIDEVQQALIYGRNSRELARFLRRQLVKLEKERQDINWS